MCHSIWYDLQLPGDTSQADVLRRLIQLRNFARKLPMESVSPIYTHCVADLFKWPRDVSPLQRHFHQRAMVSLDHDRFKTPNPELDAPCAAIGFAVHPGRGSDAGVFGFMRPGMTAKRTDLGDDDSEFDEPWEDEGNDALGQTGRNLPVSIAPKPAYFKKSSGRGVLKYMAKIRATLRSAALLKHPVTEILKHPGAFTLRILKAFKANQGILLAGAVAYYTLLSLIPFLLLMMLVLSHIVDRTRLLSTLTEYLEFLAPGAGVSIVDNLRAVLDNGGIVGVVVLATMLLTSGLAFAVLENAMSVIFYHRVKIRRRRFVFSALLPYSFMLSLSVGLFVMTIVSGKLAVLAEQHALLSNYLLYLVGVVGEILVLTAIYHVMPVGRMSWRHAFLGGVTATVLWEITRRILRWYFGSISHMQEVYGSFTTTIAVLLSVEFAAILLLLGAQVIAEYERLLLEPVDKPPEPMRTAG